MIINFHNTTPFILINGEDYIIFTIVLIHFQTDHKYVLVDEGVEGKVLDLYHDSHNHR